MVLEEISIIKRLSIIKRCPFREVSLYVCVFGYRWYMCVSPQVVSSSQYQARLESIGILIKARNFLVFQVCTCTIYASACECICI